MDDVSPIRILWPETPGPWIFASPHSGRRLPEAFAAASLLGEASLRSAEDTDMDVLAAQGVARGATLIACEVGRAFVDVNRAPDEMDAVLVEGLERSEGPRAAAGYGVVPRLSGDGRPLNPGRLGRDEAEARVAAVHAPYHAALERLMQAAHGRHGEAMLVDWHSMPGAKGGPQVVIGDRHGSSCDPDITRRLRAAFEAEGWRVGLNHPYAGGYATRLWGRPEAGFHAVQIEIDRSLYLDPKTRERSRGWVRTQRIVGRVIDRLIG